MPIILTHPKTGSEFWLDREYEYSNVYNGGRRMDPKQRVAIVVHHTAGSTAGDLRVLSGYTAAHVSVKYLVADPSDGDYRDKDGRLTIWQLLPDDIIGWSIGNSTGEWSHIRNWNSDSIEISNLGNGADVFEEDQREAVETLIAYEENRLGQELLVLGHRETSPGRKPDPHRDFRLDEVKDFAEWHHVGMDTEDGGDAVTDDRRFDALMLHYDPDAKNAEEIRTEFKRLGLKFEKAVGRQITRKDSWLYWEKVE